MPSCKQDFIKCYIDEFWKKKDIFCEYYQNACLEILEIFTERAKDPALLKKKSSVTN